jgi:hypothetical protein
MKQATDTSNQDQPPRMRGALAAQRLGATAELNPYEQTTSDSSEWLAGYAEATERLVELFEAWLALGHSIPKLAIGASGQALGPMVAGLVSSNGNTAGALLVGALAAHDGRRLASVLPRPGEGRDVFEATQYAITGHELPEELKEVPAAVLAYTDALAIDLFREKGSETEIESKDGKKVARIKFDLAAYLRALVEGLPKEGGES